MITTPTILILGAGASAHCGYPLGTGLLHNLCRLRGTPVLDQLPQGWTRQAAEGFLMRLSRAAYLSVDAFLEKNPTDAPLGKYLIARELKKCEILDKLFPPHDSGWYQYLFRCLLADDQPQYEKNLLSVVTFNYDRSLEAYLHVALMNRFDMTELDAMRVLKRLPIIHVYGILGQYPDTPYQPTCTTPELVSLSKQVQIVHEVTDRGESFCNAEFEKACALLKAAHRIFFLGFGFHPDNVRRFRFFTPENTAGRMLRCTSRLEPIGRQRLLRQLAHTGFTNDLFLHRVTTCDDFFGYTADLES